MGHAGALKAASSGRTPGRWNQQGAGQDVKGRRGEGLQVGERQGVLNPH